MRRIAWLAGFAVLAALPARAQETVTDFTLDNGMQVVVVEDHRAPVVTHMVWYRAGSADEPAGKSGIAQPLAVFFHNLVRTLRQLHRKIAHGSLAFI